MNMVEILAAARRKIASPTQWIKGCFAADKYGEEVGIHSPRACKWCLEGAIRFASPDSDGPGGFDDHGALLWLCQYFGGMKPHEANDLGAMMHSKLIAIVDKAIAAAQEQGIERYRPNVRLTITDA